MAVDNDYAQLKRRLAKMETREHSIPRTQPRAVTLSNSGPKTTHPRSSSTFTNAFQFALWLGVFAFFGYLLYLVALWLFVGPGNGLLALGLVVALLYFVFGWLPTWLSKRTGVTKWSAEKDIQFILLFVVFFIVGFYWIPKNSHFYLAWYWRISLGIAVGVLGLGTRRYP